MVKSMLYVSAAIAEGNSSDSVYTVAGTYPGIGVHGVVAVNQAGVGVFIGSPTSIIIEGNTATVQAAGITVNQIPAHAEIIADAAGRTLRFTVTPVSGPVISGSGPVVAGYVLLY